MSNASIMPYEAAIEHLRRAVAALPPGAPASCTGNFRLKYLQFADDLSHLATVGKLLLEEVETEQ